MQLGWGDKLGREEWRGRGRRREDETGLERGALGGTLTFMSVRGGLGAWCYSTRQTDP